MNSEPHDLLPSELLRLRSSQSQDEWNAICDEVKSSRGGQYPHEWYAKVIASGVVDQATARFGGGGLTFTAFR
jgi:hypothetical protein